MYCRSAKINLRQIKIFVVTWVTIFAFFTSTPDQDPLQSSLLTGNSSSFQTTDVRIYPNPTAGKITIEMNYLTLKSIKVILYNTSGHQVYEKDYLLSRKELTLDISTVKDGEYFILVKGDHLHEVGRIVKKT